MRALLTIDPGTHTGFALAHRIGTSWRRTLSGVWTLARRNDPAETRWRALRGHLETVHRTTPLAALAFEDVPPQAHKGGTAAHVYGGFRAVLETFAADAGLAAIPVHLSTWRAHVTGRANDPKELIRIAGLRLLAQEPGADVDPIPDNAQQDRIDAALILRYIVTAGRHLIPEHAPAT